MVLSYTIESTTENNVLPVNGPVVAIESTTESYWNTIEWYWMVFNGIPLALFWKGLFWLRSYTKVEQLKCQINVLLIIIFTRLKIVFSKIVIFKNCKTQFCMKYKWNNYWSLLDLVTFIFQDQVCDHVTWQDVVFVRYANDRRRQGHHVWRLRSSLEVPQEGSLLCHEVSERLSLNFHNTLNYIAVLVVKTRSLL